MRDNHREAQRQVEDNSKNLGFMAEADYCRRCLPVPHMISMRNASPSSSMRLFSTLHSETSIFSSREPPPERYPSSWWREQGPVTENCSDTELSLT
ncbi:melanoregulin [Lates japonicus]|uniref:Melanoregulin n=1 Tax=Lates japonicus TaxID=270547 RepID=A0AAD3QZ81_LATJO|nr:melanoregulin [Lates japonicus]